LIPTSFNIDAFNKGDGWSGGWTIFFWAWWMAYAPLVGMFLARIAIGRTIRQFIFVNIFVPGTFIFTWFTAFGGTAIYFEHFKDAGIMEIIRERGLEVSMYALLQNLPIAMITIPLGVLALGFSFITLADAMTSTIAAITTKNTHENEAPPSMKLFWGFLIGGITIICLLVSGTVGTQALQTMSIVYALPIFFIELAALISIILIAFPKTSSLPDGDREELIN
jgi:choline-glycine betaine transporter